MARWCMCHRTRAVALVLPLALQVVGLVTSSTVCPPEKCPDGYHCWNQTKSVVRVGWGYRNFGVCMTSENCGLTAGSDGIDFTYQMNPVIVQEDDEVIFYSVEEDLFLNPLKVNRNTFQDCDPIIGSKLVQNATRGDIPVQLDPGYHYFIHKGRSNSVYNCDFGLKVLVIVKGHNCEFGPEGPCGGHGYCASQLDQLYSECICCDGYEGEYCAYRTCANLECQNGGTCQANGESARCLCLPGYTGEVCEISPPRDQPKLKPTAPNPTAMDSSLTSDMALQWVLIQTYLPDLNCQWWEGNDTLLDAVKEELYASVRDNLLPSAVGHCYSHGAHYGFGDKYSLDCHGDGALFKVQLASSKTSSLTTKELLCIIYYYLRNNTVTFDLFNMAFGVAPDFPIPVFSMSAMNCDDKDVFTRLCVFKETGNNKIPADETVVEPTNNSSVVPAVGAVTSGYDRMALIYLILCIMIPVCLLLMIIMAVGLIVWKKKYTKSYTFKENIRLAKLGKLEGRPRSMDVETQLARKKYLYGGPPSPIKDEEFERQRNASGSTNPVPDSEIEYRPARTRVDSGTSTIRSNKGSDVRRISDDCVRIINLKPTEGANGDPHGYENKAFQFMDDNQSADSAIEDTQSL